MVSTPLAITLVIELFVLIALTYLIITVRKIRASKQWPSTRGQILSSKMTRDVVRRGRGRPSKTIYQLLITYVYLVDGQSYTNNQINITAIGPLNHNSWAQRMIRTYPRDSHVEVFYNPANPGEAVLECGGMPWGAYMLLIVVGLIGLILPIVIS